MARAADKFVAMTFRTRLGWMVALGRGPLLRQLSIGHASPAKALQCLDHEAIGAAGGVLKIAPWNRPLAARLEAYSEGIVDDFLDVSIEPFVEGAFALRVIDCCRHIRCGQTMSYGELARQAGAPRAARAVGNVMRLNRISLIVPCHRVIRAGGGIGGYGSAAGIELKRRLLSLEAGGQAVQSG